MCSCDQSLVTVAFLWEKLSQPQFYRDLTTETVFFEGWSLFKFNNLRLALGTNLKFCTSVTKGLKIKVRKFWGLIDTFVEVTGEKLVVGPLCPPPWPILNRVNIIRYNSDGWERKISISFFILLTQWHEFLAPKLTNFYIFIIPYALTVTLFSKSHLTARFYWNNYYLWRIFFESK